MSVTIAATLVVAGLALVGAALRTMALAHRTDEAARQPSGRSPTTA
jgi:hypothetical protein